MRARVRHGVPADQELRPVPTGNPFGNPLGRFLRPESRVERPRLVRATASAETPWRGSGSGSDSAPKRGGSGLLLR
jgi:hypothetical protein